MNRNDYLKASMERNFKEAFNLLGNSNDSKSRHKAYDLLFDVMRIYNYLNKEETKDGLR